MRGSLESRACSRSCLQDFTCSPARRRAAATEREPGDDLAWVNKVLRSKGSGSGISMEIKAKASAPALRAPAELAAPKARRAAPWQLSMETSFSACPPAKWL